MISKKDAVLSFVRWIERATGAKFPKTVIAWNYPAVISPEGGIGFDVTVIDGDKDYIYVAGKHGKKTVIRILAHEFKHHLQNDEGVQDFGEKEEEEAEQFADFYVAAFNYYIWTRKHCRRK